MTDTLIRGTAGGGQIRFFCAYTKDIAETARSMFNLSPIATAALGRLLTGGALMGSTCKNDTDTLTLQINCSGPIKGLTVVANAKSEVKGFVINGDVVLPANSAGKLDVGGAVDLGVLSVIKDIGLKEPYIGQTNLVTGEIAEDLTYYYATSEQIPTSIALGVLMNKENTVRHAGGFMIQLMPDAGDEIIDALEAKLANYGSITSAFEKGMTPKDIIDDILGDFSPTINDEITPRYHCDCSIERVKKSLATLPKSDIEEMIADNKPIELTCQFCDKKYNITVDELKELI